MRCCVLLLCAASEFVALCCCVHVNEISSIAVFVDNYGTVQLERDYCIWNLFLILYPLVGMGDQSYFSGLKLMVNKPCMVVVKLYFTPVNLTRPGEKYVQAMRK